MTGSGQAAGKLILLGEHAVVFGEPALAAALPFGLRATVETRKAGGFVLDGAPAEAVVEAALRAIAGPFGVAHARVTIDSELPSGGGLGSSAALAVAVCRAFAAATGRELAVGELDEIALQSERIFHGIPSGVDAAVCARGGVWRFWRGSPPRLEPVRAARPLRVVLGLTGVRRATRGSVESLAQRVEREPSRFRPLVRRLGGLAAAGADDLEAGRVRELGARMDEAHALLSECGLSCEALDEVVRAARAAGALGAKLTGAGRGGAAVALADDPERVASAIRARGFQARVVEIR